MPTPREAVSELDGDLALGERKEGTDEPSTPPGLRREGSRAADQAISLLLADRLVATSGDWFRRLKSKLGTEAAVTPAVNKLARILRTMVRPEWNEGHRSADSNCVIGQGKSGGRRSCD